MPLFRFLMLLSLVVWIGGIVFFAFVVAPALFAILPTRDLAGAVVTRSLGALHWMGIVAALVFLITSMAWSAMAAGNVRLFAVKHVLVFVMLVLTLISQFGVSARMHRLRTEMGIVDNVAASDLRRVEFNRLHRWSTMLESGVLFLGLITIYLVAAETRYAVPSTERGEIPDQRGRRSLT